ncbi:hypothetical protein PVL29_023940 [Vitis rotundifolia]|uniref:Uncharacterized protein n=1 Tax=Vitis rotundifolia TaxID=103349 RepID=A0AA39D898_VITRO|nr:hypothetical protein PVL29_023940 [Vitis rotundifolia]
MDNENSATENKKYYHHHFAPCPYPHDTSRIRFGLPIQASIIKKKWAFLERETCFRRGSIWVAIMKEELNMEFATSP